MLHDILRKPEAGQDEKIMLEMAYQPPVTATMELAQSQGWKAINGLEVLAAQGLYQFLLWTGVRLPWHDVRRVVIEEA